MPPWRRPVLTAIVSAVSDGLKEGRVRVNGASGAGAPGAARARRRTRHGQPPNRRPFTFLLDETLVERAREEVGETDVVRSIEAALVAALDYQLWVREVSAGERGLLS